MFNIASMCRNIVNNKGTYWCVSCAVTGTSGSALMYFRVNESPTMGRCSLTQDDGQSVAVEMTSQFRVFCTDWVDAVSTKNNFGTNRCVFLRRVQ